MARYPRQVQTARLRALFSWLLGGRSGSGGDAVTRGYDANKAAQFSAYLLLKAPDGMEKLKLSKLLYVAERDSAAEWGQLLFFDEHFSVKDGPICTNALSGIDGLKDQEVWRPLITLEGRIVKAKAGVKADDLDTLSEADIAIADALWDRFKGMTAGQVRNWTHDPANVPEYRDPFPEVDADGVEEKAPPKRIPITPRDMAVGLGFEDPDDYAEGVEEIRSMRAGTPFD